jgi:hypothetical protein
MSVQGAYFQHRGFASRHCTLVQLNVHEMYIKCTLVHYLVLNMVRITKLVFLTSVLHWKVFPLKKHEPGLIVGTLSTKVTLSLKDWLLVKDFRRRSETGNSGKSFGKKLTNATVGCVCLFLKPTRVNHLAYPVFSDFRQKSIKTFVESQSLNARVTFVKRVPTMNLYRQRIVQW